MTEEAGWVGLEVRPDATNFGRDADRQVTPQMSKLGTDSARAFGVSFKRVASLAIGAVGAGELIHFGIDTIGLASDLNETRSKVQQIFGQETAKDIDRFGKKAAGALGESKQEALDAASTFGIFGKSAGLQNKELSKFSTGLVQLSGDMASFSNTSTDQSIEAIGAALRGESEPIRAYGVLLNDATVKAEALRMGLLKPVQDESKIRAAQVRVMTSQEALTKATRKYGSGSLEAVKASSSLQSAQSALKTATQGSIGQLTQQQRVLATASVIYKQTKDQQGDFARTSQGLANQQRILSAEWENGKTKLGQGLLPIALQFTHYLTREGIPALTAASDWFHDKGAPDIRHFADELEPLAKDALPTVKTGFEGIRDGAKAAEPYVKAIIDKLQDAPDWAIKGGAVGLLVGYGAKKTGALGMVKSLLDSTKSSGGASSLLSGITKADPLPVYVVNNGVTTPTSPTSPSTPVVPTGPRTPKLPGDIEKPGKLPFGIPILPALGSTTPGQPSLLDQWLFGSKPKSTNLDGKAIGSADDFWKATGINPYRTGTDKQSDLSGLLFGPTGQAAPVGGMKGLDSLLSEPLTGNGTGDAKASIYKLFGLTPGDVRRADRGMSKDDMQAAITKSLGDLLPALASAVAQRSPVHVEIDKMQPANYDEMIAEVMKAARKAARQAQGSGVQQ